MLKSALVVCFTALGLAAADQSATYKNGAELMAIVKSKIPTSPDQASAPISNQDGYRINVVSRSKPGPAMAHATGPAKGTEVHYIIEGAATVVTGGTIVDRTIQGGVTQHLAKGDVLVIPAGTPHWYKDVEGTVTYLEVRFDVEKK
jgi:mannose-6-phosphate isomerase-like protein (cupin superfamily)